jgi:hypothetical protein
MTERAMKAASRRTTGVVTAAAPAIERQSPPGPIGGPTRISAPSSRRLNSDVSCGHGGIQLVGLLCGDVIGDDNASRPPTAAVGAVEMMAAKPT